MPRRAGISGIQKRQVAADRYADKATEIEQNQLEQLAKQLGIFQENLQQFASKHRGKIQRNKEFRAQFQRMCASAGVDPLASSKGFWAELLGVGSFYYELAVQVCFFALFVYRFIYRYLPTKTSLGALWINKYSMVPTHRKS